MSEWQEVRTTKTREDALKAATWQRKGSPAPVRVRNKGHGRGYAVEVQQIPDDEYFRRTGRRPNGRF